MLVANIPSNATQDDLLKLFSKFGRVERAYLSGKSGTEAVDSGFVIFEKPKTLESLTKKGSIWLKG